MCSSVLKLLVWQAEASSNVDAVLHRFCTGNVSTAALSWQMLACSKHKLYCGRHAMYCWPQQMALVALLLCCPVWGIKTSRISAPALLHCNLEAPAAPRLQCTALEAHQVWESPPLYMSIGS